MNKSQIDYYDSLSEIEQYIVNVAALKANEIYAYNLPMNQANKKLLSTKKVSALVENACEYGLFNTVYGSTSYSVSPGFLIFVFPKLGAYKEEWNLITKEWNFSYANNQSIKNLRNYLYSLLYDKCQFPDAEKKFLQLGFDEMSHKMTTLLAQEEYRDIIPKMSIVIVRALLNNEISRKISNLEPLAELQVRIDAISKKVAPKNAVHIPSVRFYLNFHLGNFAAAQANGMYEVEDYNTTALSHFLKGDIKTALLHFEKGLKVQRAYARGSKLPLVPLDAFYYLAALLCITSDESAPVLQKIYTTLQKKSFTPSDEVFKAVLYYFFNDRSKLKLSKIQLESNIRSENLDYDSLMSLLVLFLVDGKPVTRSLSFIIPLIIKAYANGYRLLAYEAAYVVNQWTKEAGELYAKIAGHFDFKPALSHISRQEDWEKTLNAFISLGTGKGSSSSQTEQGKYRVVYYVNFKEIFIQPVLQTRSLKGTWSSGRNIALKTFYQGKVEGMTQQDFRVAKKIKISHGYYNSDEYFFSDDAIKELTGHPFVFLNGADDVLVELIAEQPILRVTKTAEGYSLSTDIKDASKQFIILKETNTRYKIYDLTTQQLSVINAIKQQKIVVPAKGKEKLMLVLGNFSSHFLVHSDLLASENTHIRNVDSDSRIRVQLLPHGNGLKAELFAKPFGKHPPYCKPGKGGKTLIANEKGDQLQVARDLVLETKYASLLMENIQALESLEINDGIISFDDPMDSLYMLDILAVHPDKCVVEWPEGERYKIRGTVNFKNLNLKIKSQTNWFELQGELKVDETTVLTLQQLLELTKKGNHRFVEIKQGEFLALSEKLKKQLDELRSFSTAGKDGVRINKFASVALGDFFDDVENMKSDKSWKEFQKRLDTVQQTEVQLPAALQGDLRPYQEDGFRWLSHLAEWEAGACLADDMGLGKTIQALAILLHRAKAGAALVVCPVSVIHNWISETAKFAPNLKVKTLLIANREHTLMNLEPGDLLITSYGLLQSEGKAFANTPFSTIILDEAHTIKNYTTKTSKAAMQLQAPFRIVLTGTPVQNHLGEVWNLFNFINPGLLGSLSHFTDTFIKTDDVHARKLLKKLIAPFILRRTKISVLDELPAKTEIVRKVSLSTEERAFYEALRRQAIANLEKDDSPQGTKHLKALAEITRLRLACCNPSLVNPALNISSAKLSAFLEIISELIENKHKALVFSQFVTHLTLVREALDQLGINYQYLDGSCSMADREKSVKKFQGGDGDLFLISLKAGGLGLNLTAADYVIHLDPWWNPAVEDQASDRAHRIGQVRPVTIYRLVAENTIEEKIIQLHNTKRAMADTLLEGSDQSARLSMTELVSLIKDRD